MQDNTTWGGLAKEVRYWGDWLLKRVKAEIGDLYPLMPDPAFKGKREEHKDIFGTADAVPPGYLMALAYLWTRTVNCKNPSCKAIVPLVKQTWLCKRTDRNVALKMVAPNGATHVRFEVVEARTQKSLGFDPAGFSKAGNATCPFCHTVAESAYVKAEGIAGRIGVQPMAVVCTRPGAKGKVYLAVDGLSPDSLPDDEDCRRRIAELCKLTGLTVPDEPIEINPRSMDVDRWGITRWSSLFTARQLLTLLTFAAAVRNAHDKLISTQLSTFADHAKAVVSLLSCWIDRIADFSCTLCTLKPGGERGVVHAFTRQSLPMVWDFAEANLFGSDSANAYDMLDYLIASIGAAEVGVAPGTVSRGSATTQPWPDASFDAVITDPPYYDNVSYSNLSDFFYVWLKRTVGHLYPNGLRHGPYTQEGRGDCGLLPTWRQQSRRKDSL